MEVSYGGTLRAHVVNGSATALTSLEWILRGPATGELQCQAPSGCEVPASMLGELKVQGYEAAQLVQAR